MRFPGNKKAGLIIMVDAEGEFGRIPFSPRDKFSKRVKMLLSAILGMDYSIKTLNEMVVLLKKYNIPATFFFVGSLFLKKGDKKILTGYLNQDIKTRYLWNKRRLPKIIPSFGGFIQNEMNSRLFEVSIHNFLHESNFSEPDSIISNSIRFSRIAAKRIGFDPKTYAAPWFELEEPKRPDRIYNILKNNGIILTRFDGTREKYGTVITQRTKKGFFKRRGFNCIHSSYFIKTGIRNRKELEIIENGIKDAIKTGTIYTLSTHETTFMRHGLNHFEDILKIIKKYQKDLYMNTLYGMFLKVGK
ncbi:MAG: hypothetical protein KKC75_06835 [Nanoarchaeota archaeon]|nr:hypothetical protein [Nanoarchaeota archaeon]MBU1005599.1 hypothetical protein [Nanoarchaeota archaeon]MBU1945985.1 hypothetical protein [Nanoarchaeota archaeon]